MKLVLSMWPVKLNANLMPMISVSPEDISNASHFHILENKTTIIVIVCLSDKFKSKYVPSLYNEIIRSFNNFFKLFSTSIRFNDEYFAYLFVYGS